LTLLIWLRVGNFTNCTYFSIEYILG
jgi:hypothetical protein